jgi:hypothetical protein
VSQSPIKRCCGSIPACKRCPLRFATAAQDHEQRDALATLVEDILRGSPRGLPDSVSDALASLALARRSRSQRAG